MSVRSFCLVMKMLSGLGGDAVKSNVHVSSGAIANTCSKKQGLEYFAYLQAARWEVQREMLLNSVISSAIACKPFIGSNVSKICLQ